eukprot:1159213-Pelagomonas_calceolata.AAC.5
MGKLEEQDKAMSQLKSMVGESSSPHLGRYSSSEQWCLRVAGEGSQLWGPNCREWGTNIISASAAIVIIIVVTIWYPSNWGSGGIKHRRQRLSVVPLFDDDGGDDDDGRTCTLSPRSSLRWALPCKESAMLLLPSHMMLENEVFWQLPLLAAHVDRLVAGAADIRTDSAMARAGCIAAQCQASCAHAFFAHRSSIEAYAMSRSLALYSRPLDHRMGHTSRLSCSQVQRYEDELEAQALSLEAMSVERETARSNMKVCMTAARHRHRERVAMFVVTCSMASLSRSPLILRGVIHGASFTPEFVLSFRLAQPTVWTLCRVRAV